MRAKMLLRLDALFLALFGRGKKRALGKSGARAILRGRRTPSAICDASGTSAAIFEAERAAAQAARAAGDAEWRGYGLIAAALAQWRREPRPRYVRAIIERLKFAPSRCERMEAAAALAQMPTPEADAALVEALDDSDALVRHQAACALMAIYGVAVDAGPLQNMRALATQGEGSDGGRREFAASPPVRVRGGV